MNGEIRQISKKYGKNLVLRDISFEINAGEAVGIIGVNGSGKSTLLRILAGVQKADSGQFIWNGSDILRKGAGTAVAYVPQGTPLIEELSAYDNLRLWYEKAALERSLSYGMLKELGVDEFLKKPAKKLSGGMRKRLSVGCAIANEPEIMLLDEPTAALDIVAKERLMSYFNGFVQSGGATILVTHDTQELEYCARCYLLSDGILSLCDKTDRHSLVQRLDQDEK
ncbi:MAG: heme ABC exporter ATP-binding protein CcmA [Clostridia bacterium]|nr:heme ABC exporter ATP-binding protein CcmA [Clostridia bacterium]